MDNGSGKASLVPATDVMWNHGSFKVKFCCLSDIPAFHGRVQILGEAWSRRREFVPES